MLKQALTVLMVSGLIAAPALAGDPPATHAGQTPTIRTTTREVVLDVVVRDKHHHAIANIRPDEIQVFEDGVKQKINAFRNVQGVEQLRTEQTLARTAPAPAPAPATGEKSGTSATTLRELNFVSIVFAQIAPLNLEFAREAVSDFLSSDTLPNTYVTIYSLGHNLHVIQPYTANKAVLASAVDRAAPPLNARNNVGVAVDTVSALNTSQQASAANALAFPSATSQTPSQILDSIMNPVPQIATDPLWARNAASEDASVTLGSALLAQSRIAGGLRFADSLSTGMDTMDALRQLIQVQSKLPGRKVVLYLSDGLTLPENRRDVVDKVISYANQMEVSFYTVDTSGLSVDDPMAQSLADQQRAAAESSVNRVNPRMGHMEDDDIQLASSSNRQLAMRELAEATGGFATANTNQIALPMQRVMEDIRTHYEVAYTPSSTKYDGQFRKIEVRISRPHVTVQTRSGYFAVPEINGEPVQPYEMTALRAINSPVSTAGFPYETALLRFRPTSTAVEYEVAFDVPIRGLHVLADPKTGHGDIRVSVVALIHNSEGEIVGKVSRELSRTVSKSEIQYLGNQDILYVEPVELRGGHYVIDTAVTDEIARKTTVKRLSVFVDSGRDFGVSSLQLVRKVQPLPGTRNVQDPFETDSGRVVPTLSDSVPAGMPVGVYFVVYPVADSEAQPAITLQIYRNGQEVVRKALTPPKPNADGSIPVLLQVNPDPGECDLVVTAEQGKLRSEARLSVKVDSAGNVSPN